MGCEADCNKGVHEPGASASHRQVRHQPTNPQHRHNKRSVEDLAEQAAVAMAIAGDSMESGISAEL
eukprot:2807056-Pyramimonas_sp.AAC.1